MPISVFARSWKLAVALMLFTAASTGAARANQHTSTLGPHVEAYLQKHQLTKKSITVNSQGRPITRTFVPIVTPEQRADFEETFSRKNNTILWGQSAYEIYASLRFDPQTTIFRTPQNGEYTVTRDRASLIGQLTTADATRYIAMELEQPQITALENHFTLVSKPSIWQAANVGVPWKVSTQGVCMWWMGHAEVANKESLWHVMGVTRSVAPENLRKKLMHAGNERVSVIGVTVANIEQFNAMTDEELLGPAPAGGALAAVKE